MDKKTVEHFLFGLTAGSLLMLVPFMMSERQHNKYELELYEDYLEARASYEEAMAAWRATESARDYITQTYGNVISQLQQQIYRLESLPPKIEYIEVKVPIEVLKTVEVPVPFYDKPKYFSSYEELSGWVSEWRFHVGGVFPLVYNNLYDCDDFSIGMVTDAAIDGYILGFVLDPVKKHMTVAAVIGNDFWFIEPQGKVISEVLNGVKWVVD